MQTRESGGCVCLCTYIILRFTFSTFHTLNITNHTPGTSLQSDSRLLLPLVLTPQASLTRPRDPLMSNTASFTSLTLPRIDTRRTLSTYAILSYPMQWRQFTHASLPPSTETDATSARLLTSRCLHERIRSLFPFPVWRNPLPIARVDPLTRLANSL